MLLRGIVGIRHSACRSCVLGSPLLSTGGTLREFPFVAQQIVEVVVVPLHRVGGPCALQSTGDRVGAIAGAEFIYPAQTLMFDSGTLGFGTHIGAGFGSTVRFAERVSARDEGNCLLV